MLTNLARIHQSLRILSSMAPTGLLEDLRADSRSQFRLSTGEFLINTTTSLPDAETTASRTPFLTTNETDTKDGGEDRGTDT